MRPLFAVLLLILAPTVLEAQNPTQTDWSGGGGLPGPVAEWTDRFDAASGASFLAVPGQLALSSTALASPVEHLLSNAYSGTIGVDVGDVDGDGDLDVVGTAQYSGIVTLFVNEGGDPLTWSEQTIASPPGAAGIKLADLTNDGRLDVIIMCVTPRNKILWRRNDGGNPITWTAGVVESAWWDAWEIEAGDVDGDGHVDVMGTCWSTGDLAWWKNSGTDPITWTRNLVDGDYPGAHSVRGADLDGDGRMDLATAAGVANQISVYWNDGNDLIGWTKQVLREEFTGARSVWVGDIDQDGDPDIAAISWESGLAWWRNDGGSPVAWTEQTISTDCLEGHSCSIADINGDGRPDVLGACVSGNKIAWWENGGGAPIVWTEHVLRGDYTGAITVRAGDLDLDGDMDPVGACWTAGEFTWWEATEFASSGELTSSILDTEEGPRLGTIGWTSVEPSGTSLRFQVRSSDDPGDLGPWSADVTSPGPLPGTPDRYVQYRALLDTADPDRSPILEEVSFGPGTTGVGDEIRETEGPSLGAHPNPFNPDVTITFGLRKEGAVRLSVFDTTGRRVRELAEGWYAAGAHELAWDGMDDRGRSLSSGIYWVSLESPMLRQTAKLVLLR
jgi:hypothetical protein